MTLAAEMPVTTSAAVAPSRVVPRLDAPAGGDNETAKDKPDGIASFNDADIFWFSSLVVIA